ncbi:MAG TPA: type II secretion system protein [Candidatus Saccharimonadales bacterium]|nr:type II secretion system protein [Candidatus Saccharimonadales bacterium]
MGGHKNMKKSAGFTLVEILIVMVVVAIMLGLVLGGMPGSRASSRDKERVADIDLIHSQLEQYFSDHGGYPASVSPSILNRLDPTALTDPDGQALQNKPSVDSQYAAVYATNPTADGPNYSYTAYPSGCSDGLCTGYVLKSYIEQPNEDVSNPYVRTGLNNN